MRRTALAALLSATFLTVALAGQEPPPHQPAPRGPGPRPPDACDLKKIETGSFCMHCGGLLNDEQVAEHAKNKEFKSHRIAKRKVCVKKYYHAPCHPENDSFEKGKCCGEDMEELVDRALIVYLCEGCGWNSTETDKCQEPICTKKKMRQECAAQPNFPHTNEKLWREKKAKAEREKKGK
ncbi:MAG: hypothetical protein HYY16_16565 [Planctomycetes bacterium]|nr:hypothetical protein [Planctomycetota bacterium]